MAFLGQTFDANELPQGTGGNFEPLPEGAYNATITQAELKNTNDGGGQYIKLRLDITGPSHQGRVIFSNLNIKNASAKAEEIGRQQLGDIMRAIGLAKVTDTDQLIGGNLNIKLSIRASRLDEKTGKTYEASNEVKAYRAISGGAAPAFKGALSAAPAAAAQVAEAAPTKPAKASPPWVKK
jgi:hypothetical protein